MVVVFWDSDENLSLGLNIYYCFKLFIILELLDYLDTLFN